MLPRWHILLGAIFTLIVHFLVPDAGLIELLALFFSSFMIDLDHYLASVIKAGTWKLSDSFEYHRKKGKIQQDEKKRGIFRKGDFHLFHTLEFHMLIFAIGLVMPIFMFIFIGMAFHSITDIVSLTKSGHIYRREFFFAHWVYSKLSK
jgi:hypothetical protein